MSYGRNLEKRKFGVYYFRQTLKVDGKQIVKRFSLKTKDTHIAKFLAIQIKAKIEMIDLNNLKKFEISYDENNNIKSIKVEGESDSRNLQEFLKLKEVHKAESHKREIEKLKLEADLKEKNAFSSSEYGQGLLSLHEKLSKELKQKPEIVLVSIGDLKKSYIENLNVTAGTLYKYENFVSKLIAYAESLGIKTIDKIDKKFAYAFILYMRKMEKKSDKTIKNIFNTLSSFYNHLLQIGEVTASNPFVGHKLDVPDSERGPFSIEELKTIFNSQLLRSNEKLFFITLLLLTTGARPNEICQLWTDDFKKEGDFFTIRITENSDRDQSLKTKNSKRVIYLNQLLIDFGFENYLNSRKLGMIFDLKKPKIKTYSTFISEDFSKLLLYLNIENKSMYCFRHTVVNRLKQNLVLQSINEDLVGHEGKGTNATVYSQKHSPENLKKATEEILKYKEIF